MKQQFVAACSILLFIVGCRVMPHLANFSPLLCVALLAGHFFDKRVAAAILLVGMVLSDMMLAQLFHYPLFGSWTLFTYSAVIAVMYTGAAVKQILDRFTLGLLTLLAANLGFWLWTNFGVWAFSGMYDHHMSGFSACYIAAIPFLQYSTAGVVVWYLIFIVSMRAVAWYQMINSVKIRNK